MEFVWTGKEHVVAIKPNFDEIYYANPEITATVLSSPPTASAAEAQ
jgi:hypothetical protein